MALTLMVFATGLHAYLLGSCSPKRSRAAGATVQARTNWSPGGPHSPGYCHVGEDGFSQVP